MLLDYLSVSPTYFNEEQQNERAQMQRHHGCQIPLYISQRPSPVSGRICGKAVYRSQGYHTGVQRYGPQCKVGTKNKVFAQFHDDNGRCTGYLHSLRVGDLVMLVELIWQPLSQELSLGDGGLRALTTNQTERRKTVGDIVQSVQSMRDPPFWLEPKYRNGYSELPHWVLTIAERFLRFTKCDTFLKLSDCVKQAGKRDSTRQRIDISAFSTILTVGRPDVIMQTVLFQPNVAPVALGSDQPRRLPKVHRELQKRRSKLDPNTYELQIGQLTPYVDMLVLIFNHTRHIYPVYRLARPREHSGATYFVCVYERDLKTHFQKMRPEGLTHIHWSHWLLERNQFLLRCNSEQARFSVAWVDQGVNSFYLLM